MQSCKSKENINLKSASLKKNIVRRLNLFWIMESKPYAC